MPRKDDRLEKVRLALRQKAAPVSRLLASADGVAMMQVLEDEFFNGPMLGNTPEQTAFNCGAREVVVYLRSLRDYGKEKTDVDPLA